MVLFMKTNTLMSQSRTLVKRLADLSKSQDLLTLRTVMILQKLFKKDQSQQQLMLVIGQHINLVLSLTAVLNLIMVYFLQEQVMVIGGSKIHGEFHGERKDSSDYQVEKAHVVFAMQLHTQTNDDLKKHLIKLNLYNRNISLYL